MIVGVVGIFVVAVTFFSVLWAIARPSTFALIYAQIAVTLGLGWLAWAETKLSLAVLLVLAFGAADWACFLFIRSFPDHAPITKAGVATNFIRGILVLMVGVVAAGIVHVSLRTANPTVQAFPHRHLDEVGSQLLASGSGTILVFALLLFTVGVAASCLVRTGKNRG